MDTVVVVGQEVWVDVACAILVEKRRVVAGVVLALGNAFEFDV